MRVRILKPINSTMGLLRPGQVMEVHNTVAEKWLKKGLAMQDKSLDGAKETKAILSSGNVPVKPERVPKVVKPPKQKRK